MHPGCTATHIRRQQGMAFPLLPTLGPVDAIAHNIQLAVAPVFLLSGIAGILNVLTTRLARVVDRARHIEADIASYDAPKRERALDDLAILDRRMVTVQYAVAMCTLSALFVCLVVAILFVGDLFPFHGSAVVATLFVGAMILLSAGLVLFLVEVWIATRSVRVQGELLVGRRR